ncbi:MAG: class I SAM-dependent methyltransferase [Deltaproteobacteria bacterium]|nr:class I SAM-dependent methyltransferase [Deltaproteobacteria bacterium]
MKGYKQVIAERYDGREAEAAAGSSRYGLLAPTGWYLYARTREAFAAAARYMQAQGLDWRQARVVDLGCGGGAMLRFAAELTGDTHRVRGVELSQHRLAQARRMHPAIDVQSGDLLDLPAADPPDNVAMAWTVLMHLPTRPELDRAVHGIAARLPPGGWFLWYDTVTADHFRTRPDDEGAGFSLDQFRAIGTAAGLRLERCMPVLKNVLWRWNSGYLPERGWPAWAVRAAEVLLPGRPASALCLFRKPPAS